MSRLLPSVPLTVPHWYGVDSHIAIAGRSLQSPTSWDALRTTDPEGSFGFGQSRASWIARASSHPVLPRLADEVVSLMRRWDAHSMVSVGVGTAMLEYLIRSRMGDLVLRCGDYTPASLEVLRNWFTEAASVELMDLRDPAAWVEDPAEVVLLNRVDTELTDDEWRVMFGRLAGRGVQRVIWIPCGLITRLVVTREVRSTVGALLRRYRLAHAGYLRTERRMRDLFLRWYDRTVIYKSDELPIWALGRRPNAAVGA